MGGTLSLGVGPVFWEFTPLILLSAYANLDTISSRDLLFQSAAGRGIAQISVERRSPRPTVRDPSKNGLKNQEQGSGSTSRFSSDVLYKYQASIQNRLVYPELAQEYGWEGRVRIGAVIDEKRAGSGTEGVEIFRL